MRDNIRINRKLKGVVLWAVLGIVLGAIFPIIALDGTPQQLRNGIIAGFLVGALGSLVESFLLQQRFRRLPFSIVLFLRVVFYLLLISAALIVVIAFHQSGKHGITVGEAFYHPEFREFLTGGEFYLIVLYTALKPGTTPYLSS